jgi:hypothetical protein
MTAFVRRVRPGAETIVITASMTANGRYLWEPEPVLPEIWTDLPVTGETWTPQTTSSQTWTTLN